MEKIALWWRVIRPHTLFASAAPVLVALMLVAQSLHQQRAEQEARQALRQAQWEVAIAEHNPKLLEGLDVYYAPDGTMKLTDNTREVPRFRWGIALLTLLCALALQVFANLVNDVYDYRRGTDTRDRAGFARALAEGVVSEPQMRRASRMALVLAAASGIPLAHAGGAPIFFIGILSILFAWLYTATNHSLSYMGVADIFVFLFFGVLATLGTAYLQSRQVDWHIVLAGGVNGVISMSVLCINNLRDEEEDRAAGKRTLVVRFGKRAGQAEMIGCALLSLLFAWMAFGLSLPCLVALPMAYVAWKTLTTTGKPLNRCLVMAGLCNMAYVALVALQVIIF